MGLVDIYRQVITLLVGLIFGAIVSYFMTIKTNKKLEYDDKQTMRKASMVLLKSEIHSEWRRLTARGYVYDHELDLIRGLYTQYEALGGNSATSLLRKDIDALPKRFVGGPVRNIADIEEHEKLYHTEPVEK